MFDWLLVELRKPQRLLVGIDMAFALPAPFAAPPQLWAEVDALCAADADFWGGAYAQADPRFWHRGARPAGWLEFKRPAELACRDAGLGRPETPLKLIGAKQVGKGALAGMRLLHRLCNEAGEQCAVWPFCGVPDRRSVIVEIYPRLFIRSAGLGDAKLRVPAQLNAALRTFDSQPSALQAFDDHQADALISAAGLRQLSRRPALWQAGLDQPQGWIFGVPAQLPENTSETGASPSG